MKYCPIIINKFICQNLLINGNTEEISFQNYFLHMLYFHNGSEILFEDKAWQKCKPKLSMQLLASRL